MSNKIIAPLNLAQDLLNKQGLYSSAEVRAFTIPESALSGASHGRRKIRSIRI